MTNASPQSVADDSDLIVIATPSGTPVSGDTIEFDSGSIVIETRQEFAIDTVLKGDADLETLNLLYLKPKHRHDIFVGASFRTQRVVIKYGDINQHLSANPRYLLYLKKLGDGEYELTTGRILPDYSVRELIHPIKVGPEEKPLPK